MPYDIIIRGANIHDGESFVGKKDIGIINGFIESIGNLSQEAKQVIDAEGLLATPGFIDVHSHATLEEMTQNDGANMVYQGITTAVTGNCGKLDMLQQESDLDKYFQSIQASRPAVNIASLIGHNAIRRTVMGNNANRKANQEEINAMKTLLERSFEYGSIGFSSGLMYTPGSFAHETEIISLLELTAKHDLIYTTHMRDEGDDLVQSVKETIRHAAQTGVRTQISHHKAVGSSNHGKTKDTLELIDQARQDNDINTDVYLYTCGATVLKAILPKSIVQEYQSVKNIPLSSSVLQSIEQEGKQRVCSNVWEDIIITDHQNPEYIAKSIAEIAGNNHPERGYLKVLQEDESARAIFNNISSENDIHRVLAKPYTMLGSDGYLLDSSHDAYIHPRNFGNFSGFIQNHLGKEMTLEEGIRRITSLPANTFKLEKRGFLREGYAADILLFNPDNVQQMDSIQNPCQLSKGMDYVIINGGIALHEDSLQQHGSYVGSKL